MKYLLVLTVLMLASCAKHEGHDGTHMHASEAVEIAQNNAKALAPTAPEIKFDDEGMPKMGSQAQTAPADTAKSDTPAADDAQATEATDAPKATNDKSSTEPVSDDSNKTDDKK